MAVVTQCLDPANLSFRYRSSTAHQFWFRIFFNRPSNSLQRLDDIPSTPIASLSLASCFWLQYVLPQPFFASFFRFGGILLPLFLRTLSSFACFLPQPFLKRKLLPAVCLNIFFLQLLFAGSIALSLQTSPSSLLMIVFPLSFKPFFSCADSVSFHQSFMRASSRCCVFFFWAFLRVFSPSCVFFFFPPLSFFLLLLKQFWGTLNLKCSGIIWIQHQLRQGGNNAAGFRACDPLPIQAPAVHSSIRKKYSEEQTMPYWARRPLSFLW